MYAAHNGKLEIVKLLLAYGANIEHKDKQGNDAISAAKKFNHEEIVQFLEQTKKSKK